MPVPPPSWSGAGKPSGGTVACGPSPHWLQVDVPVSTILTQHTLEAPHSDYRASPEQPGPSLHGTHPAPPGRSTSALPLCPAAIFWVSKPPCDPPFTCGGPRGLLSAACLQAGTEAWGSVLLCERPSQPPTAALVTPGSPPSSPRQRFTEATTGVVETPHIAGPGGAGRVLRVGGCRREEGVRDAAGTRCLRGRNVALGQPRASPHEVRCTGPGQRPGRGAGPHRWS